MNQPDLTRFAILAELHRQPTHGYALAHSLTAYGFDFDTHTAGLYRHLRALVAEGLLEAEWDLSDSGPAKRVHRLTDAGRDFLVAERKGLHDYALGIRRLLDAIPRTA